MSVKSRYTNKGGTTCQHAIKDNIINFAQNLENAIKVLDTLQSSLESCWLILLQLVHFVGSSHPPIWLIKNCKLSYVHKSIVTIWPTWLKSNHIGYKNIIMNTHVLNTVLENDIPKPIMISMF